MIIKCRFCNKELDGLTPCDCVKEKPEMWSKMARKKRPKIRVRRKENDD